MQKRLTSHEIIQKYKAGERDFSNIICNNGDFNSFILACIVFRESDLSYSSFDGTDLTDADFSDALLDWSSFRRATLRRTNFTGAKMHWCALNGAIVDKTIFRKADLSWSIMFNTDRNNADWTDANFLTCAFDVSEIGKISSGMGPSQLAMLKDRIPYDIWLRIKFSLQTVAHDFSRTQVDVQRRSYSDVHSNVGYNVNLKGTNYSVQTDKITYSHGVQYSLDSPYTIKKKDKKDLPF